MKFIVFFALLLIPLTFPSSSYAVSASWSNNDARCVGGPTGDVATIQGLQCLFFFVLQAIVAIAGLAFLFMFITGGFQYLFSSGDQKAVAAASSTLTMAFVGLIGIIASWLIIKFISDFTGLNITNFYIPGNT